MAPELAVLVGTYGTHTSPSGKLPLCETLTHGSRYDECVLRRPETTNIELMKLDDPFIPHQLLGHLTRPIPQQLLKVR